MKIDEVKGYSPTKQLAPDRKVRGEKKFDQLLNDAMDRVVHEERAGDEVSPVKKIDFPPLWDHGHVDDSVMQHAYDILDLLEEYSQALNNPKMTLKGIEPIVSQIEQELKGLDVESVDNVGQNDELASIIKEIAVTARIETFKFHRGDYIA